MKWPVKLAAVGILLFAMGASRWSAAADPLTHLDPVRYGPGTLIAALEELPGYDPALARDLVLGLLGHPDHDVARTAAWYLRRAGLGADGVDAASTVLSNPESEPEQRVSAALAIGVLKQTGGQSVLRTALSSDSDEQVRAAAAWALGELFRPGAADVLSTAARSDQSERVRAQATAALGKVPDADGQVLISILQDTHPMVRLEAAWALGRPGFRDVQGLLGNLLRSLQSDSDCRVQAAAAWALAQVGDPSVREALEAAQNGPCRLTSQAAAWAKTSLE